MLTTPTFGVKLATRPGQSALGFDEPSSNMAAQGIDSGNLALDLILHDIAEHTLQVTGATGVAIAIEWEGALVCRAAAGATAPDLGVKVNAQSGLSGTCVRERKMQWCSDTEYDERVDAEASRALGVRSIIVMPLFVADRMVGVFEIFSPRPARLVAAMLKPCKTGHGGLRMLSGANLRPLRPPRL